MPNPASGQARDAQSLSWWQSTLAWVPGTQQYRSEAKLKSHSRASLLFPLSGLVLLVVLAVQFLGTQDLRPRPQAPVHTPEPAPNPLDPFGDSVYRQEAYYDLLEPGTQCRPRSPFSSALPVTHALTNMALEAEAKRMAAEFEYSAEDVNKGVKEFIREMEEGLEKQGTSISQIPTYVTSVPNGTEKVADATRS
jgi:hypothetical protein